ncbi:hypothetical protein J4530_00300 [Neisseria subflava]|uniref:hypothetical protein n=1 Tax=Neisseria subflava TaxID=28449 RepID=UPI00202A3DB6|nr:hypothetical protein [Neisseria subflava]MCL9786728.1 hypothetical protein [Neisseria subflava]
MQNVLLQSRPELNLGGLVYWECAVFVVSARVKADTATAHLNALERKQLPFAYSLA